MSRFYDYTHKIHLEPLPPTRTKQTMHVRVHTVCVHMSTDLLDGVNRCRIALYMTLFVYMCTATGTKQTLHVEIMCIHVYMYIMSTVLLDGVNKCRISHHACACTCVHGIHVHEVAQFSLESDCLGYTVLLCFVVCLTIDLIPHGVP